MKRSSPRILVSFAVPVLIAFLLIDRAMRHGIGIGYDSVVFLLGAKNLAQFGCFCFPSPTGPRPITHFPPLFSVLVARLLHGGLGITAAAEVITCVSFIGTTFCVSLLCYLYSGKRAVAALWGGILTACSIEMLHIYSLALSEAPAFFFGLSGMALAASFVENRRYPRLIAAGCLLAAAILTRYAAIAFAVTSVLVVWRGFNRNDLRQRMIDSAGLGGLSFLPLLLWFGRNWRISGSPANRTLEMHTGLILPQIPVFLRSLSRWLLQDLGPHAGVGLIVLALIGLLVAVTLKDEQAQATPGLSAQALFCVIYLTEIFLSLGFYDPGMVLEPRYFLPVFLSVVVLAVTTISRWEPAWRPAVRQVVTAVLAVFMFFYIARGYAWAGQHSGDGQEYAAARWTQSALLAAVPGLPELRVYSNETPPLYFYTVRIPFPLGEKGEDAPLRQYRLDRLRAYLRDHAALLVLFHDSEGRDRALPEALARFIPIKPFSSFPDGQVFLLGDSRQLINPRQSGSISRP